MDMNRDFKGVWIPKEIWLSTELKMLEKVILTEISSLDNEDHCTAGNEYLAEFCSCSLSAVSKAIKHLKELGYIEELEFDGRHRKLRVVNFTRQHSKIYETESQNLQTNNIDNKQTNKKELLSKDNNSTEFQFGRQKPNKQSLYTKFVSLIDSYDFSSWGNIRRLLVEYLQFRLSVKDKPLYFNMWKGMLNKLVELCDNDVQMYESMIKQSIERGYLSFYPISNNSTGIKSESGANHVPTMTKQDYEKEKKKLAELEARGVRVRF